MPGFREFRPGDVLRLAKPKSYETFYVFHKSGTLEFLKDGVVLDVFTNPQRGSLYSVYTNGTPCEFSLRYSGSGPPSFLLHEIDFEDNESFGLSAKEPNRAQFSLMETTNQVKTATGFVINVWNDSANYAYMPVYQVDLEWEGLEASEVIYMLDRIFRNVTEFATSAKPGRYYFPVTPNVEVSAQGDGRWRVRISGFARQDKDFGLEGWELQDYPPVTIPVQP